LKILPAINKHRKSYQGLCQSGKISLNLVTLRQHKDILILNSLPEIREIPPRLPPSPFHLQISSFKDIENFLL